MALPKTNCKAKETTKDGYEFGAYRDQIGNVSFLFWKCGVGFKYDDEIKLQFSEVKKFRDWLTKIIDHVERK